MDPLSFSQAQFVNEDAAHRQMFIAILREKGMTAHEYHSGGGLFHVCIYLVEDGENWLAAASGNAETPCDVGLMGDRGGGQVGDDFHIHPQTMEEAAAAMEDFWQGRERWIRLYHDGLLDYV